MDPVSNDPLSPVNPMTFEDAWAQLLINEGGFTVDRGGATKYGISQNSYPQEDIANLTEERAQFLYQRDFWVPASCDSLPSLIRFEVFDSAVQMCAPGHPEVAIRLLQRAAGMAHYDQDGQLGPQTLLAVGTIPPWRLLVRFLGVRIAYYTSLPETLWHESGRGWMNRVSNNALHA